MDTFTGNVHTTDWQLSKDNVSERIRMLHSTSQWSDCSFKVGSQTQSQVFRAHKLILAASSPVFEAMCYGPLAEEACVKIPDVEPEVFRILLEYIYTDVANISSVDEAAGVLYAAKKYMLPHLCHTCHNYIIDNLRPSNAMSIFEFANEINEEQLLEPCIKVMCGHTKEVLKSVDGHMSSHTLNVLLSQHKLNISETELFETCIQWAEVQCSEKGLERTPENMRAILMKAGALSKIRFLSLTVQEFAEGPESSGILTPEEIAVLKAVILEKHGDLIPLPEGMCSVPYSRDKIAIKQFYCARKFLKTAVTISGHIRLLTKVLVDKYVKVSGIRVFTRLVPQSEFNLAHGLPREYRENLDVSVLDQHGTVLSRTLFTDVVEYNTLSTVNFEEPIVFSSNKEYSILMVLPCLRGDVHEYPLSFMSQTEKSRGIEFRFFDHADIDGNGTFVRRLDMGFVDAIVYSV
ncbi:BTB/POZ domain-containing protein 6-like [Schistocerca americana]|uniref:BTB/POZ domain-containing protein 6-like n=1 Tax=Schistocerca americana TaxID=7009 RepID=UPI001F503DE5|nr:BTB/POZ domain-containing protein 6-like [Schistocerca americana]XP_047116341.1 BTB/POZ domain-containing protein 6-like [Schistocerca piceifrons]XP_049960841.1 BTB/POZ domain-containing protein 6-like [Schistocerca serialis cubense]